MYLHLLILMCRYLKIKIDDVQDYKGALAYIKRLYVFESENFMKLYGKCLLQHEPQEATEYLVKLCTASRNITTYIPCVYDTSLI